MLRRLGYACLSLSLEDSSPRGTVLRNATPDRLRQLIALNLDRLGRVLSFNVEHEVQLFRISSGVIPFGSHPVNTVPWWDEFRVRLTALGDFVQQHDLRVSMHPGQYTLLSSPDPNVLAAARRDLDYHTRFLDALNLDSTHKIVLHVGGAYGDKSAALARWAQRYDQLPTATRARLVLENDERLFGAEDVLTLAAQGGAPVVLDVFHHRIYAGHDDDLPNLMHRAAATWHRGRDGVQKIHYSSQADTRRPGAHADYIDPQEFRRFLDRAPRDLEFDCMLEAKAKDLALFRLRQSLASALGLP